MTSFALMSETDRKDAGRFWLEALKPYHVEEVREAFVQFTRKGPGYPNPQSIVGIILENRKRIGREIAELEREQQRRKEWEEEQARAISPEERAERKARAEAIMKAAYGSDE